MTIEEIKFINEEEYAELQAKNPIENLLKGTAAIDENGEYNWDCPCLGGLAQPPCGFLFKDFIQCTDKHNDEPQLCMEKLASSLECFRAFPDIYKDVLDEVDKKEDRLLDEPQDESVPEVIEPDQIDDLEAHNEISTDLIK